MTRGKNERGASAVEYGLMIAGIGLAVLAILLVMQGSVYVIFGGYCAGLNGGPCQTS